VRRNKNKKPPLSVQISQAGLSWSKRQFIIMSALLSAGVFAAIFMAGVGLLPALGAAFAAGLGAPRWLLGYLKKRRETKFLAGFPHALHLILPRIRPPL